VLNRDNRSTFGYAAVRSSFSAPRITILSASSPGIFNTPLLQAAPENVKAALSASVPFPKRLGMPEEYAQLALTMITNGYFNGEDVRLDGAIALGEWRSSRSRKRCPKKLRS
jgi:hypothetical protein